MRGAAETGRATGTGGEAGAAGRDAHHGGWPVATDAPEGQGAARTRRKRATTRGSAQAQAIAAPDGDRPLHRSDALAWYETADIAPAFGIAVLDDMAREREWLRTELAAALAQARHCETRAARAERSVAATKRREALALARQAEAMAAGQSLAAALAERDREIAQLEAGLRDRQSREQALLAQVQQRADVIEQYRKSTSWRVTAPLRAASRVARAAGGGVARLARPAWWLATGQFGRFGRSVLPLYRRRVPAAIRSLLPRGMATRLLRRLEPQEADTCRPPLSPLARLKAYRRDRLRLREAPLRRSRRLAVFAAYSRDETVPDYVRIYLSELRKEADTIIFVADNALPEAELDKIRPFITHHICGRHGEYDFGSYKRGYGLAAQLGLLELHDQLILCNDSCFGPIATFRAMFASMTEADCDFWGVTESHRHVHHLQSYFLCLSQAVFRHAVFADFLSGVKQEESVTDVVLNYEVRLTERLEQAGFRPGVFVGERPEAGVLGTAARSIEHFPRFLVEHGSPLVKVKAVTKPGCNLDGIAATLGLLRERNAELYDAVIGAGDAARYLSLEEVAFSVIMPTRDRAHCIADAIDSLLAQQHANFELIIVDDASSDGTGEMLRGRYGKELDSGRIVYLAQAEHGGVSRARNVGLGAARNPWIAYLDSDNTVSPYYLALFAQHIVAHPQARTFYAQFCRKEDGYVCGKEFDRKTLLRGNYIDLGVFVHHRDCASELGGFDEALKRLVDWDLILNYTEKYQPVFIPHVLMQYTSQRHADRVTVREPLAPAWFGVLAKRSSAPTVSTLIPCYNQQDYIAQAIESALAQKGDFVHEIIVADDGSSDATRRVVRRFAQKYPKIIRDVGSAANLGISANYRRGFLEAKGSFLATLEGDDYWTDERKLEAQAGFLIEHPECSMVFSRIKVLDTRSRRTRYLARQTSLKGNMLTGRDFLAHGSMNLIGNFSSCMFRTPLMQDAPALLFEKRLSEIAVAFYLENFGKIGYLDSCMSVYRQHAAGVWSGSSRSAQRDSGRETRIIAKAVAQERYKADIQRIIDTRYAG